MKKIIKKNIKKNLLYLFNIGVNYYNHFLARRNLENYPQLAIFAFDHIGLRINLEGRYENHDLLLIREYLESVYLDTYNSTALDIGANIGNHSIYFSEFFENVLAFEPNPRTFALLKVNADYISLKKNIKCFNYGLSNENGQLLFESSKSNLGGSNIVSQVLKFDDSSTFLIDVKRADEIELLFEKKISLIKIDIEGHELQALMGARELIKKTNL